MTTKRGPLEKSCRDTSIEDDYLLLRKICVLEKVTFENVSHFGGIPTSGFCGFYFEATEKSPEVAFLAVGSGRASCVI